jgi:hypothetical protein
MPSRGLEVGPKRLPRYLTVATTGASGSIFRPAPPARSINAIQTVNFIASDSALRVMARVGLRGRSNLVGQIMGRKSARKIQQQANADIGPTSQRLLSRRRQRSLSHSMGTLARIANARIASN